MKNYDNTLTIEATPKAYMIVYNGEDCIFYTENLKKAMEMAKESARCATQPCTHEIIMTNPHEDVQIMKLTVK